jgi:hypothetical protein
MGLCGGKHGGKSSVVFDNTLDRQFDVVTQDTAWDEPSPPSV